MRSILYIIILVSMFFVPLERVRISQLLPVRVVAIREEGGGIVLETDNEVSGKGDDVSTAVDDLKENAAAVVYLDTAQYLLVSENATGYVGDLKMYLKGSVKVYITDEQDDLSALINYLDVHVELPKLRDWEVENNLKKAEKSS